MLAFFLVSIRFEVRGGFRPEAHPGLGAVGRFQSALRFAVVSDECEEYQLDIEVSIRFEVRGGFRR